MLTIEELREEANRKAADAKSREQKSQAGKNNDRRRELREEGRKLTERQAERRP
jgi:phosphohistidine phosphatase SixA